MALNFGARLGQTNTPSNADQLRAAAAAAPAAAPVAPPARIAKAAADNGRDIFAGIEGARASFAANYLRDGRYFALIRNLHEGKTRKGEPFVVNEMTILAVLPGQENLHRPGEEVSHMMMANNDSFLGNLKSMIAGIGGCHADEVTAAMCKQIVVKDGESSPLAGTLIEVVGRTIRTKKDKDFTVVTYKREITATELVSMMDQENGEKIADAAMGVGVLAQLVQREAAAKQG